MPAGHQKFAVNISTVDYVARRHRARTRLDLAVTSNLMVF